MLGGGEWIYKNLADHIAFEVSTPDKYHVITIIIEFGSARKVKVTKSFPTKNYQRDLVSSYFEFLMLNYLKQMNKSKRVKTSLYY